ncbi:hypothetical protein [Parafrankia elaeagni]|nr:hypothetical protein [Parafrankia elaeagni]
MDLGAGTLDVSLVEVNEDLYEVHRVLGDNDYGETSWTRPSPRR